MAVRSGTKTQSRIFVVGVKSLTNKQITFPNLNKFLVSWQTGSNPNLKSARKYLDLFLKPFKGKRNVGFGHQAAVARLEKNGGFLLADLHVSNWQC